MDIHDACSGNTRGDIRNITKVRNIKLTLEYDGTSYCGWQRQPKVSTVQGCLEKGLASVFKQEVKTVAAGRTDAGVHATGQVVSFKLENRISLSVVKTAINSCLPDKIRIKKVKEVDLDFHAQRSALSRVYRYIIYNDSSFPPFYSRFVQQVTFPLRIEKMKYASNFLLGEHDFSSFQSQGSPTVSSWRRIDRISFIYRKKVIIIYIKASSFLYRMTRNIVGTLVEVGRGKIPCSQMKTILEARDRKSAGPTVPPRGLYLVRVNYDRNNRELSL